jgi:thiosulfate/3-mercaptopyruvate sulfurtransferase
VRTLVHAAAVALAGAIIGLGANALSPRPAALGTPVHSAAERGGGMCAAAGAPAAARAPRISVAEAKALCDACTAGFVDARTATEYAAGHVTNAVHLPPAGHPGEAVAIAALRAYGRVVVYDGDYSCALADDVAARLRREGLPDVRVLEGAWPAWVAGGGSGTSGFCPVCHEPGEAHR